MPQSDAHNYLQEYSISLGPSEDPNTEQRGVMVIKSKNKTRAKQRKGAVANWKVNNFLKFICAMLNVPNFLCLSGLERLRLML